MAFWNWGLFVVEDNDETVRVQIENIMSKDKREYGIVCGFLGDATHRRESCHLASKRNDLIAGQPDRRKNEVFGVWRS